jgi:uncharacterized protein involved in exopolysaccharide biosynthesis
LRTELLGQIVAAESELERVATELTRGGAAGPALTHEQHQLAQLRRRIDTAGSGNLATLRGEIAAAITQAQTAAQQSKLAGTSTEAAEIATLPRPRK